MKFVTPSHLTGCRSIFGASVESADSNSERNLAGWEPPSILLMNR
jgi:hypothetical protein